MKKYVLLFCAIVGLLNAKIINVPADHAKIQLAINASVHGDTVVVYPGTYYENINFKGKNIVVTSRFYETNDKQFILNTVINGSQPAHPDTASCVLIVSGETSSAILQGFTLTEGKGTRWTDEHGAGIYREGGCILITESSPLIRYNYIVNNEAVNPTGVTSMGGGGIRIGDGGGVVENNVITLNRAHYGGGIVLNYCSGTIIRNNMILENSVRSYVVGKASFGGGGIWVIAQKQGNSSPNIIENNTIFGNVALDNPNLGPNSGKGGGVYIYGNSNATVRNNIIWENHSAAPVSGLTIEGANVAVEYNTVMGGFTGKGNINVDPQFADSSFLLQSDSPCVDAGDSSAQFHDPHFGINPELAVAPSQGTKKNDMGAYGGPGAEYLVPFARASIFTPLDAMNFGYHLPKDSSGVYGLVYFFNLGSKSLLIDSVRFTSSSDFTIDIPPLTTVKTNSSILAQITWKPKEMKLYRDTLELYHTATYKPNPLRLPLAGSAIPTAVFQMSTTEMNFGSLDVNIPSKDSSFYVYNLGTGEDSVTVGLVYGNVQPAEGIDVVPKQFKIAPSDSQMITFTFTPPIIKKVLGGTYNPKIRMTSFLGESLRVVDRSVKFRLTGTLGVRRDVAAAEHFSLSQNYPNPFNPVTTIRFSLPAQSAVRLSVYDLLGREIGVLVDEELPQGTYRVPFDASYLSSGVYMYTLRSGAFVTSKKLTVMK